MSVDTVITVGVVATIAVLAVLGRPVMALAIVTGTSLVASLLRVAGSRRPSVV